MMPVKMTNRSFNYQYTTYFRNLNPKPDAVIISSLESQEHRDMIFRNSESCPEAKGCYRLAGGFFSNNKVEKSDLEKAIVGIKALKNFEAKYSGKFFVPTLTPLFPASS